jgi:tRNA threonylcarbamoyladenosine biosynthesis protein TsaE
MKSTKEKKQKLFELNNIEETASLANLLAKELKIGDIVAITGDLGVGKTTLCQNIIKFLCGENTYVTSPTFNIVQLYDSPNFTIYHFDLFRLKHQNEIYELGIEDAWNRGVSLIEWPEIIIDILPEDIIKINLSLGHKEGQRICSIM